MVPNAAGDRVVLLHGQPGRGREWRGVADALGSAVGVIAPDRPGYRENPLPAGGLSANVDWLTGLVETHAGSQGAIVAAHSWAGGVALAFALRRPDLARGLVLVGSVGPGGITGADRMLARAARGGGARLAGRGPGRTRRTTWARRAVVAFLTEQAALVRDLPAVVARLEEITTRTIVVSGTRDRIVRVDTARALAGRLPNAELVAVPGAGHLVHRTHPDLVAAAVRRVLAGSSRN